MSELTVNGLTGQSIRSAMNSADSWPLSTAQRDIYWDQEIHPASSQYHLGGIVWLHGPLEIELFAAVVADRASAHDAFRLRFALTADGPRQHLAPSASIPVLVYAESSESKAREWMRERFALPIDLHRGVAEFAVFRLGPNRFAWWSKFHHLALDGWSCSLFFRRVLAEYARRAGLTPGVAAAPAPLSYERFARASDEYLASPAAARDQEFWREKLTALPPLLYPQGDAADRVAPRVRRRLPWAKYQRTVAAAQALGVTPFVYWLGVLTVLLHRTNGAERMTLGFPLLHRSKAEYKETIGLFSAFSLLLVEAGGDLAFPQLLARIEAELKAGYRHARCPVGAMYRIARGRHPGLSRLFDVVLSFEKHDYTAALPGFEVQVEPMASGEQGEALRLYLREYAEEQDVIFDLDFRRQVFHPARAETLADRLLRVAETVADHPHLRVGEIDVFLAGEREQLLTQNNPAPTAPVLAGRFTTVLDCWQDGVANSPQAIAIECGEVRWTRAELDAAAQRVADDLRAHGLTAGDVIGMALPRSPHLVAALLGVWRVGASYLPLDLRQPSARREIMQRNADAILTPDGLRMRGERARVEALKPRSPAPDSIAYQIFTSGSTGEPKAVRVSHRALTNCLASFAREPGLSPGESLLALTTLGFDIAALEIFLPLVTGARLVLATDDDLETPERLVRLIERLRPDIVQTTPTWWRLLLAAGWSPAPPLRLWCGGEAMPADLARDLRRRGAAVWNLYGPTETTIWSLTQRIDTAADAAFIGRPIANTRAYILDRHGQLAPRGEAGELYLGGAGVAVDYAGQDALTAERFLPDPFSPGARMYRTGDLAQWEPGANGEPDRLRFLGRKDRQFKRHGVRIELGEIEAVLRAHPQWREAAVAPFSGPRGETLLAAYLVPRPDDARATPSRPSLCAAARRCLGERLPRSMIPDQFVVVASLPRTANGKLDLESLAALATSDREPTDDSASGEACGHAEAPRPGMEQRLATLWCELLEIARVSRHERFYELGGDSLLAMQLIARAEVLSIPLALRHLQADPTLAELAELVASLAPALSSASPCTESDAPNPPASFSEVLFQGAMENSTRCPTHSRSFYSPRDFPDFPGLTQTQLNALIPWPMLVDDLRSATARQRSIYQAGAGNRAALPMWLATARWTEGLPTSQQWFSGLKRLLFRRAWLGLELVEDADGVVWQRWRRDLSPAFVALKKARPGAESASNPKAITRWLARRGAAHRWPRSGPLWIAGSIERKGTFAWLISAAVCPTREKVAELWVELGQRMNEEKAVEWPPLNITELHTSSHAPRCVE